MNRNAERQAAFRARMRADGRRQLTLWVTPQQTQAIRAFLRDGGGLTPLTPPVPPETTTPSPLPVTPREPDTVDSTAPIRRALAEGLEPRFKKAVLAPYGEGWAVFVGPHRVGHVWKAPPGSGWEGRQTLRVSFLDALAPHRARTRVQVVRAVLAELDL